MPPFSSSGTWGHLSFPHERIAELCGLEKVYIRHLSGFMASTRTSINCIQLAVTTISTLFGSRMINYFKWLLYVFKMYSKMNITMYRLTRNMARVGSYF